MTDEELQIAFEMQSKRYGTPELVKKIADVREWDNEELSDYLNGNYNVQCGYCEGRSVTPVTDDKDVLMDIAEYNADMQEWQAEMDLESRMLGEY